MKLRNKKTGELNTRLDVNDDGDVLWVLGKNPCVYRTLAELNAEWEDYKPKEPLIKDEKVRKAVRAWAEANDFKNLKVSEDFKEYWGRYGLLMEFEHEGRGGDYNTYTIAELCGEEE